MKMVEQFDSWLFGSRVLNEHKCLHWLYCSWNPSSVAYIISWINEVFSSYITFVLLLTQNSLKWLDQHFFATPESIIYSNEQHLSWALSNRWTSCQSVVQVERFDTRFKCSKKWSKTALLHLHAKWTCSIFLNSSWRILGFYLQIASVWPSTSII